jgi:hypothetical protein
MRTSYQTGGSTALPFAFAGTRETVTITLR